MSKPIEQELDEIRAALLAPTDPDATNSTRRPNEDEIPREHSWTPIPISLSVVENDEADRPTLLPVRGGSPLLYEGKVNAIYGETESGKSLVALAAVDALLREDPKARALWLDYEDNARTFRSRCRAFAMDQALVDRIDYLNPRDPISDVKRAGNSLYWRHLDELLATRNYRLAVIDTVNEALAVEGADPNSVNDYAIVNRYLMASIASRGAAVVTLDHVTKSREGRGKYAYGSVGKLNSISGAAYLVEVTRPWSRARNGRPVEGAANVKVTKDRPGFVRDGRSDLSTVAVVEVLATPDGLLDVRLVLPEDSAGTPSIDLIRRIVDLLRSEGPMTTNAIAGELGGNTATVKDAVKWLRDPDRRALVEAGTKGRGVALMVDETRLRELDLY